MVGGPLRYLLAVVHTGLLVLPLSAQVVRDQAPRLILQITVDQLRGDLPASVLERCGQGGFRYLYGTGVVYANAHHRHANTETIVGHATLATGADPAGHGMVGNVWFDQEQGRTVYNIEDDRYALLGEGSGVDRSTEKDPTLKVARSDGRSPRAMLTSTFSDELALATNGRAKIFSVSVKDRGAVPMSGRAGKAFWFSRATGGFVSSTYYYDTYPAWVEQWNARALFRTHANTAWDLLHERSTYTHGEQDDAPWEVALPGFGRVFPHPFGEASHPLFTTFLMLSPVGDELTLDFAKELIVQEGLGKDDITDHLSISFSSTDYIGHVFGPSSLESEDNLLRLDRTLAELFRTIDEQVGLEHTLIVLSADHGAPEVPGRLDQFGFEARYFVPDSLEKAQVVQRIKDRYGIARELIAAYEHPYLYLDHEVIRQHELRVDDVSRAIAAEITSIGGIAHAVASIDLKEGKVPDTRLDRQIQRNYHPDRSGDIHIVLEPHCFVNDFDGLVVASAHGSPWRYDTYVPIVFAGHGSQARTVYREVGTVDVALTLSLYLGINAPSGAVGAPLEEVLR